MAKFCLKKPSKRIQARQRYKIEKKVREHNRKLRKEAKKNPKKTKGKIMQIPNQCPFKEDILKEVEAMKKQNEEEKQKLREAAKERKKEKKAKGLEELVSTAEDKQLRHDAVASGPKKDVLKVVLGKEENSLKAYYKEFKKVLDSADVILEVVDARDPLGTRCKQVEEAVQSAKGNKRLVLVLNKADLVPRENLDQWLKYLRASLPAVAFKASTQDQSKRLGRKKLGLKKEDMIQSGACFGAELLLSLLGNYCRNAGAVKSSIRVGVVGLPNVGKSSIINSLKRSKACNVGSTPGITKSMQAVQLDSKIKLLDSPGIVFATSNPDNPDDSSVALKNAVKIQALKDPYTPATAILKRISKQQIMELYDMHEYSTPDEFFAKKAARMGMFKRGGVPDLLAAARSVINDWNSGKIRYYTVPPEAAPCQLSAEIVTNIAKEFDIENFAATEKMMLDDVEAAAAKFNLNVVDPLLIDSTGPVECAMDIDQKKQEFKIQEMNEKRKKIVDQKKKEPNAQRKKKVEPLFQIEGNQKLNKLNKLAFKKEKKDKVRREKEASNLANQLEGFNFSTTDDYNFETDFTPK
ncbi:guanine nucleotide-binding protein-like 3 homolog [Venturia canescens]|uniref:guanine nucleotide-binding protein-like 3 homolog n=1 Tax=Venturia canescens TaxID=32260 RepID=UPI001C9D0CCC|nr:guanine nucleotide-binding protein-like 3 homolog [Venturia canescens]